MSAADAASGRAEAWRSRGSTFPWAPPGDGVPPVDVFHVETGSPDNPTLLLVHGFPTCSIDWLPLVDLLSERFHVCALDFPGYGFSGKPLGWGYSIVRDAQLLDHYLAKVVGVDSAAVVAHDRGTSVSLLHTVNAAAGRTATRVDHLVLTNGNIYLPLSNLTDFQRLVLDPATAPGVLEIMTPALLAEGMGRLTFTPPRTAGDPEVDALAATFAHDDGIKVLHETIQYLVERADHETEWLEAIGTTDIPTAVIWGMNDTVAPPRVATYVWHEFLMRKPGANRFYLIPDANHYLQDDRPGALAMSISHALDSDGDSVPGVIDQAPGSPVLVDVSRPRMPTGRDALAGPDE